MRHWLVGAWIVMATPGAVQADVLYQESFTYWPPAAQTALRQVWGDVPERVTNTWGICPVDELVDCM